jgi:hypothetical protein
MKKFAVILILSSFIHATALSQSCLPEGITFSTQTQIDNFQSDYPGCTMIQGDVDINSGGNITNLNGLSNITTIRGSLSIASNWFLFNFTGFGNLDTISGNLEIISNQSLNDLVGFENLDFISGELFINNNNSLIDLNGLQNLSHIGDDLTIADNYSLVSLLGLNNVSTINGNLSIVQNWDLMNLNGFSDLDSVIGHFYIYNNDLITDLDGLQNLKYIGNGLDIIANNGLLNLFGLNNLNSINGSLRIESNRDNLTSLSGLGNIDPGSISELWIDRNNVLSYCAVLSICNYLASPDAVVFIYLNYDGCNYFEVQEGCLVGIDEITPEQISIYPNPETNEVFVTLENGQTVSEITIFNQLGQNVLNDKQVTGAMDVSGLQPGIYIVEVVVSNSKIMKKLVIK